MTVYGSLRDRLLAQAELAQRAGDEGWYEPQSGDVLTGDAALLREAAAALSPPALEAFSPTVEVSAAVNRFLGWPLPKGFAPDCGISFDGRKDDEWNKGKTWPIGTNLLSAEQAKAMFEYCLATRPADLSAAAGEALREAK